MASAAGRVASDPMAIPQGKSKLVTISKWEKLLAPHGTSPEAQRMQMSKYLQEGDRAGMRKDLVATPLVSGMGGSAAGGVVGTALCPGAGTVAGMFIGYAIGALSAFIKGAVSQYEEYKVFSDLSKLDAIKELLLQEYPEYVKMIEDDDRILCPICTNPIKEGAVIQNNSLHDFDKECLISAVRKTGLDPLDNTKQVKLDDVQASFRALGIQALVLAEYLEKILEKEEITNDRTIELLKSTIAELYQQRDLAFKKEANRLKLGFDSQRINISSFALHMTRLSNDLIIEPQQRKAKMIKAQV